MLHRRLFLMAGIALCLTSRAFGADAAYELVMVEEHGCPWCARWNAEIGPIYPKTPEGAVAPLRRLDITELSKATLAVEKRVVFTPTFILARDGAEIGRIEGYPGEELFWWFLAALMTDNNLTVGGDTK